jgi:hypothetical protein
MRSARVCFACLSATFLLTFGSTAAAKASDTTVTTAYVRADYELAHGAVARIPAAQAALGAALAGVRRECSGVAAGSPQDPMSTQLSTELIGTMVLSVFRTLEVRRFVGEVASLRWTDHRLTAAIHGYATRLRTLTGLAHPSLCADIRSWAGTNFQTLSAGTLSFAPRFMAAWVGIGELPQRLQRYESGSTRRLARSAEALEARFSEFEARAAESWDATMAALGLWP